MTYRREIDGLRAVAVIPVILYHAGFAAFSGGYVGVDVFFVISGYLITSIIRAELDQKRFSLVKFYERRARRILPALFFVIAACFPFVWFWMLPSDAKDFAQSVLAVSLFSSNILFWRESGYFDRTAEFKPLLHTWSLAVEEQFYLLFPLFLRLIWRLRKRWIAALLAAITVVSLAAAQWGAHRSPSATFFLLPTRAWELAIGALIALWLARAEQKPVARPAAELFSLAGIALIAYSVFAFGADTPFPSLYALAPTVGTALLILFASPKTLVGRVLATRALVAIGLISYSAYLWHQPMFVFARYRSYGAPAPLLMLALAAASIGFAYFSWRFVERPFRTPGQISRGRIFAFAAVGTAAFALAGIAGQVTNGFAARRMIPASVEKTLETPSAPLSCFDRKNVHSRPDWLCTIGAQQQSPSFAVFGDSHALAMFEAFDSAAHAENVSGVFTGASGCPPLAGIYALRPDQQERNCHDLNSRMLDYVASHGIRQVFLIGRWTYYTDGGYSGDNFSFLGLSPDDAKNPETSRRAFRAGVVETLARYRAAGARVTFLEQVPQQLDDPAKIYLKATHGGVVDRQALAAMSVPRAEYERLEKFVAGTFVTTGANQTTLTMNDLFCAGERCLIGDERGSYYRDDDHLSPYGAARLIPRIRPLLRNDAAAQTAGSSR